MNPIVVDDVKAIRRAVLEIDLGKSLRRETEIVGSMVSGKVFSNSLVYFKVDQKMSLAV
jgi:hypothetical protein